MNKGVIKVKKGKVIKGNNYYEKDDNGSYVKKKRSSSGGVESSVTSVSSLFDTRQDSHTTLTPVETVHPSTVPQANIPIVPVGNIGVVNTAIKLQKNVDNLSITSNPTQKIVTRNDLSNTDVTIPRQKIVSVLEVPKEKTRQQKFNEQRGKYMTTISREKAQGTSTPQSEAVLNLRSLSVGFVGGVGAGVEDIKSVVTTRPDKTVKNVFEGVATTIVDAPKIASKVKSDFKSDPFGQTGYVGGQFAVGALTDKGVKSLGYVKQQVFPGAYKLETLPQGSEPHKPGSFNQYVLRYQGENVERAGRSYGIRRSQAFDISKPSSYGDALGRLLSPKGKGKYQVGRIKNFDPIGQDIVLKNVPSEFATPVMENKLSNVGKRQAIISAKPDTEYISEAYKNGGKTSVLPGGSKDLISLQGRAGVGGIEFGEFYAPPTAKDILTKKKTTIKKGTPQAYIYYTGVGRYDTASTLGNEFTFFGKKPGLVLGQEFVSPTTSKKPYVPLSQELGFSPQKTQLSASTLRGVRSELEVVKSLETKSTITRQSSPFYLPGGEKINLFTSRVDKPTKAGLTSSYENLLSFSKERITKVETLVATDKSLLPAGQSIVKTELGNIKYVEGKLGKLGKTFDKYDYQGGIFNTKTVAASSGEVLGLNNRISSSVGKTSIIDSSRVFPRSSSISRGTGNSVISSFSIAKPSSSNKIVSSSLITGGFSVVGSSSSSAINKRYSISGSSKGGGSSSKPSGSLSSIASSISSGSSSSSSYKPSGSLSSIASSISSGSSSSKSSSSSSSSSKSSSSSRASYSRGLPSKKTKLLFTLPKTNDDYTLKKKKNTKVKQPKGYKPSVYSAVFNIKGKQSEGAILKSGLGIRPINTYKFKGDF